MTEHSEIFTGVKIMHGSESGELAVAEAMTAVVKQRELTVAFKMK